MKMDAVTISTYADIGTAVGTFLLAIVTFLTLREMRKERTPKIEIISSTKFSDKYKYRSKPVDEYYDETNYLGSETVPTTVFEVLNKGQTVVTLDKFELWLEDIEIIDVKPILGDHYDLRSENREERFYVMVNLPAKHLPYDLLPNKNYRLYIYVYDISKYLIRKQYSGDVNLFGYFIDQIGNSYKSEPYYFDIENQGDRASEDLIEG